MAAFFLINVRGNIYVSDGKTAGAKDPNVHIGV